MQGYSSPIRLLPLLGGADTVFLPLQREDAPGYTISARLAGFGYTRI